MIKKFIIRIILFLIFLFIVGELFFRFIIPASNVPYASQIKEYHVMCFDTTQTRDGIYTSGRFSLIKAPWHVNNYGFLADIDYRPGVDKDKPRVAIIGDSFITGFIIPWEYHVANVLSEKLDSNFDVYSIGTDGGTLIQYTEVAKWVEKYLNPDILVFCLNTGDVESSVYNYDKSFRTNKKLNYENGIFKEIDGYDFKPNRKNRIIRNSAIARYLWMNRKLQFIRAGQIEANADPGSNILDEFDKEQSAVLQKAADYCLNKMSVNFPEIELVYIVDANRYKLYRNETKPEKLPVSCFIQNSVGKYGGTYLDLTDMFFNDYQVNHKKFDWDNDYHWNFYAHELVARSIYEVIIHNNLLETP